MISNEKFNRRLKIKRWLKVMASWPLMVFMVWLSYSSINELISINNSISIIPKVKLAGLVNNVASFVGLLIFGFIAIIPIAMLHRSTELLLKVPFSTKTGLYSVAIIVLSSIASAIWLDNNTREKIKQYDYIECTSEQELTLKSSSRTYVLDPSSCD
ncbi:hypothetical protein K6U36_02010 [Vibrio alginolyticus]|uniref:hypothetical protein n=1 Tax=Vibrio alginolyticus TaxID=663 RepID=UPI001EEC7348|nr:hypothetical protein [Vibrio alginolyticus]MCG6330622.1 hypothetical protein [Vibrio alginolyticus]MCG6335084.1 hypothetical protein [Vibrio alginolyticus]MCG6395061.1 hypothetical protein [Vibrio alginolyticus]